MLNELVMTGYGWAWWVDSDDDEDGDDDDDESDSDDRVWLGLVGWGVGEFTFVQNLPTPCSWILLSIPHPSFSSVFFSRYTFATVHLRIPKIP